LQDAFLNLPSLEYLSLRYNVLHEVPQLPHSTNLRRLLFHGKNVEDIDLFEIPEGTFAQFSNLVTQLQKNNFFSGETDHAR
jgi:hypothetical protein